VCDFWRILKGGRCFAGGLSKKLGPDRDPQPRGERNTTPQEADGRCTAFVYTGCSKKKRRKEKFCKSIFYIHNKDTYASISYIFTERMIVLKYLKV